MAILFLDFELDVAHRELRKLGVAVAIPPKAFDVLCYLVQHRDRLVSKSELLDAFWQPNVSEAALQKTMSLIRKALRDDDKGKPIVKTHHGLGFRFVTRVEEASVSVTPTMYAEEPTSGRSLLEQRQVSMLCVRVCEIDFIKEINDESLSELFEFAREVISEHRGHLMRMNPQGFTVEFGLRFQCEDSARWAAHASAVLSKSTKSNGIKLKGCKAAFGISTGLMEVVDDLEHARWALPGEVERNANVLAESAATEQILLCPFTLGQLRDEIETRYTSRGNELLSIGELRSGIPGRPLKRATGFIGRQAEMAFLSHHMDALKTGRGEAVQLSGPAGIGKTRLVTEFLRLHDHHGQLTLKLQCLPALSDSPLTPIRELCRVIPPHISAKVVKDDLDTTLLDALQKHSAKTNPRLAHLSDYQRRLRSIGLVDRLLKSACEEQPLVLIFEDVHWIDATSRDYLDSIVRNLGDKRLFVVLTSRPVDRPPITESVLQLSPLNHHDSFKLMVENFDQASVDHDLTDTLIMRAGGNPFFIEELAMAANSGADPRTDLPDTVQAVIAARIGAVDPGLRVLLHIIAAIGPSAAPVLVGHMIGQNIEATDAKLDQLVRMGFVQIEPTGISFRHMLILDTAYAMIATGERRSLHSDIADYLESEAPDWTPRPETLAWHHHRAGNVSEAISYWSKASKAALRDLSHHETVKFAQNGLALIESNSPNAVRTELDLLLSLAPALTTLNGYGAEDVGKAYSRARDLSLIAGNVKNEIRSVVGLWIHTWVRGRLTDSLQHAKSLLTIAGNINDPAMTLQAHASMGQVLMHKGELFDALTHLTKALSSIDQSPPGTFPAQNAAVACASYASWIYSMIGQSEKSQELYEASLKISEIFENPFAQAIHFGLCGEPFFFLGDVERCLDCADHAIKISRENDFVFWLGTGLVLRGWAKGQKGSFDCAFEALNEGIEVFEGAGASVQLANWYGLKAEVHLAADQLDDGLSSAEHALNCAKKADDVYFVPRIHATLSGLHEKLGLPQRAAKHLLEAQLMAAEFGMTDRVLQLKCGS